MIRAVLFDLDRMLLDVDIGSSFMDKYTRSLAEKIVPHDVERGLAVLASATYGLLAPEVHAQANASWLLQRLSDDLNLPPPAIQRALQRTVAEINSGMKSRPEAVTAAHLLMRQLHERGLKLAVATTPIYPRSLITERLRSVGVQPWVDHVACLEANRSAKPHRSYFVEMASALGAVPEECLIVGEDTDQDLPALGLGMAVHFVGPPRGRPWIGDRLRFGAASDLPSIWADALG